MAMSKESTVIITGIHGFVGSYLANHLLHHGYSVIGVGRRTAPPEWIASTRFRYHCCNLMENRAVKKLLEKESTFTHLVHLAGQNHVPHSWQRPSDTIQNHLLPATHLLECLRTRTPPTLKRIILTGSAQEYGDPGTAPLSELSPVNPTNPYGWGKWLQTELGQMYAHLFGLPIVTVRPFNLLGPGMRQGVCAEWIRDAHARIHAEDWTPLLVGDVTVARDWLDVRDAVAAMRLLLDAPIIPGEVFNLCSGHTTMLSRILDWVLAHGHPQWRTTPDPKRIRTGEPRRITGNNVKIRTTIPWKPTIPLEQSLTDMWEAEK